MGCYDSISLGYSNLIHLSNFLPNHKLVRQKFVDENLFQSKDIESAMGEYFLDDDGKLYVTYEGFGWGRDLEETSPPKFLEFTGEVTFYTSYVIKREWWCDFVLKIKDGKFDIKKVKFFKNLMR
jgi:hypothetical protein